jgi:hypothetical protein
MPQPPAEFGDSEVEQIRAYLATEEWTADLHETSDATADLLDENRPEHAPPVEESKPRASSQLPIALLPKQRTFGFYIFVACALAAILISSHQSTESSPAATGAKSPAIPLLREAKHNATSTEPPIPERPPETQPARSVGSKPRSTATTVPLGKVTFESRAFATSERSVAAVFIIHRTEALRGAAVVKWAARSGSADAGIDFSDASGTVRFADGQKQRAIYVPLRNDLLKEADETFKVCLRGPRQARIAGASCAEATIRDDDGVSTI